ncbi:MAG: SGNH/GDSL hydrolase family protein [Lentisphaeria bacterium]|nr:SGNH/GDSL hydrolase family protein [Lentisphaeria bacterium]
MPTLAEYKERLSYHFNTPNSKPWTWVFYGDSITHGAAHTHGWRSFPEIFHERVRWELKQSADVIINTAYSGQTAMKLSEQEYFQSHVSRFAPDAVFLLIGTNDIIKTEGGAEGFRKYLESIVEQIVALDAVPVVQNYPPIAESLNPGYIKRYENMPAYNKVIEETAQKYNALFVDHWSHWKARASTDRLLNQWLGETIHPGARGHFEMAMTLFKALDIHSEESACCRIFN